MLILKGFNSVKVSNEIQLPNIVELLKIPNFNGIDLEELYRYVNSDMKSILDNIPLTNKRKYVTVNLFNQILSPTVLPAPRGNWHLDVDKGTFHEEDNNIVHLLLNNCTAGTEFMKEDLHLEELNINDTPLNVELYVNKHLCNTIEKVTMPSNKFVTFNGAFHLHKAVRPKKVEHRFTLRVNESDFLPPKPFENSMNNCSFVFDDNWDDYSTINSDYVLLNDARPGARTMKSILQMNNSKTIVLHYNN